MAWQKQDTETLGGNADVITLNATEAKKFNQIMAHTLQTSNNIKDTMTIDNITSSTYAQRRAENGSMSTGTSQSNFDLSGSDQSDHFEIINGINIAAQEKLFIASEITRFTAGAGTAPQRNIVFAKQTGTSAAFTRVDVNQTSTGDFATDSNASWLGTD